MSGTAAAFPAHLWCQAILQVERQLLLLRNPNMKPNISAYAHVCGLHDYNAAPFVPISMETLVYNMPKRRGKFADNCSKGYVLGTAFEHYRSWILCMKNTRDTLISAKVFHKHKHITNPEITTEDQFIAAAGKLVDDIKGCIPPHLSETTL